MKDMQMKDWMLARFKEITNVLNGDHVIPFSLCGALGLGLFMI